MSDSKSAGGFPGGSRDEKFSALFAHLVMQQTNLAMMLLGKVPHPETGKTTRDLETAQLFVDMLEMLEAKTKGNLTRDEQSLLKQSLMSTRLAFVESVDAPAPDIEAAPAPTPAPAPDNPPPPAAAEAPASPAQEEEHRKKFSKKY